MKNVVSKISLIILLISFFGCMSGEKYTGSGNLITELRELPEFNAISNSGLTEVIIKYGKTQKIEITIDDNLINNLLTEVSNSVLKVKLIHGSYNNTNAKITVTMPNVTELKNNGIGKIHLSGFLDLDKLKINNNGAGYISLNGSGENLEILNNGVGKINAFGFNAINCKIKNHGAGFCEVSCSKTLNITNSGVGSVYYKGEPEISSKNNGVGKIKKSN